MWVASSCKVAEKNRLDVLKTRREEQTECNSPLILGRGNWSLFRQSCHHQVPGTTTRTTKLPSRGGKTFGVGVLCCNCSSPPEGMDPRAGATPPRGGTKTNGPPMCNATPGRQLVKETAHHCTAPFHFPRVLAVIPTRTRLLAKFVMFR